MGNSVTIVQAVRSRARIVPLTCLAQFLDQSSLAQRTPQTRLRLQKILFERHHQQQVRQVLLGAPAASVEQATSALTAAGGNVERAVGVLLGIGSVSDDEPVQSTSSTDSDSYADDSDESYKARSTVGRRGKGSRTVVKRGPKKRHAADPAASSERNREAEPSGHELQVDIMRNRKRNTSIITGRKRIQRPNLHASAALYSANEAIASATSVLLFGGTVANSTSGAQLQLGMAVDSSTASATSTSNAGAAEVGANQPAVVTTTLTIVETVSQAQQRAIEVRISKLRYMNTSSLCECVT
jgi:hypothetical protein